MFSRSLRYKYLPVLIALLGIIYYFTQTVAVARTARSDVDEGLYLLKGYLFATHVYTPFASYQLWTNKGPLAFLIPGYIELIFGPGIRTGRYFSIFLGVLAHVGLWIAAQRVGNKWLGALAVWALALSSAVGIYSIAITQVITAAMMSWMLAFSLGKDRPLWQLILAGLLSGVMILTRQNMVMVLPILSLYVLWQYGWKPAIYATIAGAGVVIIGHIIYWPNILQLWVFWLPRSLTPFLDYFRRTTGQLVWTPDYSLRARLSSVADGFLSHYFALAGSLLVVLLWPKKSEWKDQSSLRSSVFLGSLFGVLLVMHFLASTIGDYCAFCFSPYLAFYSVAGILFFISLIGDWDTEPVRFRQILICILTLIFFTGIGFSQFSNRGNALLNISIPGSTGVTVWNVISDELALDRGSARVFVTSLAGFVVGIGLLIIAWLISRKRLNYGYAVFNVAMIAGVLAPFFLGRNVFGSSGCSIDVISAEEKNGAYLASVIPPGSLIFWDGGPSLVPLLYVPKVRIFPAQLNPYTYNIGGDSHELLRLGYWNDQLKEQWINQAEFIIVEERRYSDWKDFLSDGRFDEFPRAPYAVECYDGSRMRIFHRKP